MSVLELADLPGPFTKEQQKLAAAVEQSRELKARLGNEPAGWPAVADGASEQAAAPNLVAAFWNMRASLGFHRINGCLPGKAASVATLLGDCGAALLALEECPLAQAHADTWRLALRNALPPHWRYVQERTGGEAAGFLYDSRFMTLLLDTPLVYNRDDWPLPAPPAEQVRRPPALAVFRLAARRPLAPAAEAPPPAVLTVLCVHLKSSEPATAQKQLRVLGSTVLAWAEAQAAQAAPPQPGDARPLLLGGDFNLGGPMDAVRLNGGATYAADAWQPLLSERLAPLLPPGTVTNAGPPVSDVRHCYDHVLARGVAPREECCALAYAHVAMQVEQADAEALLAALDGCVLSSQGAERRRAAHEAVKSRIRAEVYDTWSDHWPIVAPMRILPAGAAGCEPYVGAVAGDDAGAGAGAL